MGYSASQLTPSSRYDEIIHVKLAILNETHRSPVYVQYHGRKLSTETPILEDRFVAVLWRPGIIAH